VVRVFTAKRHWFLEQGLRLDATAYGVGGLEAHDRIVNSGLSYQRLSKVARLFHTGRAARVYVRNQERGVPFLSSSDVLMADLDGVSYVSKLATANLEESLIGEGWTLISRSGTVGNTAYARQEMVGMAASEDVLRAAPYEESIRSGYLFAFLSSQRAQAMIQQKTYGSVIQHIEPHHIADLPVPLPDDTFHAHIHALVVDAAEARSEARRLLDEASGYFDALAGSMPSTHEHAFAYGSVRQADLGLRLDAFHHVGWASEGTRQDGVPLHTLGHVSRPGIVKRIYVEHGVPFVSGIDVYQVRPSFRERIMRAETEKAHSLIKAGQILIQRSGQRYGLLGRPVYVGKRMDGWAATEDLLRVTLSDPSNAGWLFAFMRSELGRRIIVRGSYGTSLPHLNPEGLASICIPLLPQGLADKAQGALALREYADASEEQAIREVEAWLG